ncbi:extracellular solute-binding protein [Paenibacillus abyssi]|uniref:Maltotriose-binding protein n=1 Tax=Paenibacillus abyssi TaxID=1340531 RepID=A0A917D030_9BACL|nr:extracellular solute-binding protein [Paenibacillus abyssi]GGG04155.1 maltotriose-binding protein [Paenibacillus abyssi]
MRIRFAGIVLVMIMLTTGCNNAGIIENENEVPSLEEQPVKTVVIWHTYSDEETRVFESEVIPAFEAEFPNIHIESVRQAHNQEYQTALMARASADKTPDVIRMDYTWVPRFAHHGLLYPLDLFSDYKEAAAELRSRMLDTNRYGEHIYGLPLNMNTKAAIYNRMLLREAGITEPPDSLSEVIQLAREHHYTIGMSGLELWNSLPYFFGLGGHFADESFSMTDGYLNSEESIQAVQALLDLYDEGILNPDLIEGSGDLWTAVYSSKRTLMIDEGPWYYSILLNSSSLKVDILRQTHPVPFPSGGDYESIIGGESLVLTKGSKVKEEAWTFIRWMMQKETQRKLFKTGLIPTNMEAFQGGNGGGGGAENQYIEAYINGIEEAFYRPALPRWNEIELIYNEMMEDVFLNERDVKEALDEASSLIDALIE